MSALSSTLEQQMLGLAASVFDANSCVLFLPDAREGEEPETSRLADWFSMGDGILAGARLAPGQGLAGWILRNRKPLMVPDFDGEHSKLDYYKPGEEARVKAFMGCPLPTGGCLCVDTLEKRSFTEKDSRLLQLFAEVVDGLLRRRGAEEATSEIPGYFLQLGLIGEWLSQYKHWSVFIRSFLASVSEATGFEYCAFASVVVQGESYCIEAENAPLLVQSGEPFYQSVSSGLAGWVFRNGQPVVQTGFDGRAPALFGTSDNLPCDFEAVICLPVTISKSTRGVVCLGSRQPREVGETMRTFLRQALVLLSLHLENLYLKTRLKSSMEKAQIYRKGPRLHDPDTSPYQPPRSGEED
ncbi:MAG: GAF domain-containing protein [Desulfovibrio sp.]|nr:GAF domain-containing protein [Desulfovibrio sp.]